RRRRRVRSVHSDRMGCGIEPRKEELCGGRDARTRRRQHVRHRYARCRRSAGVEGHITSERSASDPERSHVRPQAAEPTGPHREGEEPKPMMHGREKSDPAIVAVKPANKEKEAHCGGICGGGRSGAGGAKGGGQGEYAPAQHVLGSEPGPRDTGAGAYTATLPSPTRGGSRMRESRTYGSVRGAR